MAFGNKKEIIFYQNKFEDRIKIVFPNGSDIVLWYYPAMYIQTSKHWDHAHIRWGRRVKNPDWEHMILRWQNKPMTRIYVGDGMHDSVSNFNTGSFLGDDD